MGVALDRRGIRALCRPYTEAAEQDRLAEDNIRLLAAGDRAVEYCRDANTRLAEIHLGGLRTFFALAALESHVGQVRLAGYLEAANVWRTARYPRQVAIAALAMREKAKRLLAWLA